jgi:hypothetical protein
MNSKRFALSTLAVFVTIFVTDFLIHGVLLKGMYSQTAQLWRSESEMGTYFPIMMLSQLLLAGAITYVFPKGYERKGLGEGVRYGLCLFALFGAHTLGMIAWLPITVGLLVAWLAAWAVQSLSVGVVCAAVYKAKGGRK